MLLTEAREPVLGYGQDEYSAAAHSFASDVRLRLGNPGLSTDYAVRNYGSYEMLTGGGLYRPTTVLVRGGGPLRTHVRVLVNPNDPHWRQKLLLATSRASEQMLWVVPGHRGRAVPNHAVRTLRWADGTTLEEALLAHGNNHGRALHRHSLRGPAEPVYEHLHLHRPEGDTVWNGAQVAPASRRGQLYQGRRKTRAVASGGGGGGKKRANAKFVPFAGADGEAQFVPFSADSRPTAGVSCGMKRAGQGSGSDSDSASGSGNNKEGSASYEYDYDYESEQNTASSGSYEMMAAPKRPRFIPDA